MDIKIITKQIYEEHVEEQEVIHKNAKVYSDFGKIFVEYENEKIVVDENEKSFEILRGRNNIFVKQNEEKSLNYETPYGKINLVTIGEKMLINMEPFLLNFEYQLKLNDQIKYKNEIKIIKA